MNKRIKFLVAVIILALLIAAALMSKSELNQGSFRLHWSPPTIDGGKSRQIFQIDGEQSNNPLEIDGGKSREIREY